MELLDKKRILMWLAGSNDIAKLKQLIDEGVFDVKDYRVLANTFVGKTLENSFCNGFFGSREYYLRGAEIVSVKGVEGKLIQVVVEDCEGNTKIGELDEGWADWKTVCELLREWTDSDREY